MCNSHHKNDKTNAILSKLSKLLSNRRLSYGYEEQLMLRFMLNDFLNFLTECRVSVFTL